MSAPEGPDPDAGLSPADRVWAAELREISEENEGWGVSRDRWGQFWAQWGDDEPVGPVSCTLALRALIGAPRPRKATP